jgi:predicted permease
MKTGISWLDVRLGLRMLVKHPALTLVGGLGMAVAIAIGAGFFALIDGYVLPPLPLDQGERVVGIHNWDAEANEPETRSLHDFAEWRGELRAVEDLGAFQTIRRNLIAPDGRAEPVHVAEMTASGFRVARVAPLLGRPLVDEDEQPGAPPVVVIGHDVWRTRFGGDSAVVGRTLRLGSTVHTIVGVMPEGFAFPMNFRLWTPLRVDPAPYARRRGPELFLFGRLARGATEAQARAELEALGRRAAAAHPATHAQLRPRLVPFTATWGDVSAGDSRWLLYLVQLLVSMLLVVVAVNVAILVYARTATRRGEIVVRSALGASRRRIVAQLFVEALVLSAAAAVVGLMLAAWGVGKMHAILEGIVAQAGGLPFWIRGGLSTGTVLYAAGLAVLGAVIVGVVPGVQATGRRMQSSLRQLGGGTGMQLGRTWTLLIVAQVAFAVAVLPAALFSTWLLVREGYADPGFPAHEFLVARLEMDHDAPPVAGAEAHEAAFGARYTDRMTELARRLAAEPGVAAVTFAFDIPGVEASGAVEVPGARTPPAGGTGHPVRFNGVDAGFFGAFGIPVLAGRPFGPGDPGPASTAVIVNRTFVQTVLGGGDALGRRVRHVGEDRWMEAAGGAADSPPGRWHEIVGVVGDLPAKAMDAGEAEPRMYHPATAAQVYPAMLSVRLRGMEPAAFSGRMRDVATALDPTLRPHPLTPLDQVYSQGEQAMMRFGAVAITLMTVSVLLLSAAGIYALMSFTVTRRRREIGIRSALGADPRRILRSIFSRAAGQLGAGLAVGLAAAALLDGLAGGELLAGKGAVLLPGVAVLMLTVGLLAALGPARRGLRIQPMEALREE